MKFQKSTEIYLHVSNKTLLGIRSPFDVQEGMLNDLKNRGIKDVLFFCVDGLPGFKEAIQAVFPSDTSLEKMLYLASRNITQKWTQRYRNWDQVLSQLIILYDERLTPYL